MGVYVKKHGTTFKSIEFTLALVPLLLHPYEFHVRAQNAPNIHTLIHSFSNRMCTNACRYFYAYFRIAHTHAHNSTAIKTKTATNLPSNLKTLNKLNSNKCM